MEPILLQTSEADAGTRLDACLASAIEDLTRSAAAKAVEDGRVLVNGKAPNKSYKLTGHEQIEFTPEEPAPIDAVPQDIPLDVVYEDDDVIVVNKPSGLVVHPAPGHPDGTLVNALLYHCGDSLSGVGGALRPGIVHRIDRDTSGLIIAAKTTTRTSSSPPSWPTTRSRARMSVSWSATYVRTAARSTRPSRATAATASAWPSFRVDAAR